MKPYYLKKLTAIAVIISVIITAYFQNTQNAQSATYTWNQTGWAASGTPGSSYVHPDSGDTDTNYDSKDSGIDTSSGTSVTLSTTAGSATQTYNGDGTDGFNLFGRDLDSDKVAINPAGTTGQGVDASVRLTTTPTATTLTQTDETSTVTVPSVSGGWAYGSFGSPAYTEQNGTSGTGASVALSHVVSRASFPSACTNNTTGGSCVDHAGTDWIPTNGETISGRHYNVATFTITSGYTVYAGSSGVRLEVQANNISIVGNLVADGYGDNTAGKGGEGSPAVYSSGGGGGYGGAGGDSNTGHAGGSTYPSDTEPLALGSPGGALFCLSYGSDPGGNGGGAIYLYAVSAATISGTISANGASGVYNTCGQDYGSGGGSGGSIWINSGTISGSGTVRANGGSGGVGAGGSKGGPGGGGRIALEYVSKSFSGSATVNPGTSGYSAGGSGSNTNKDYSLYNSSGTYTAYVDAAGASPAVSYIWNSFAFDKKASAATNVQMRIRVKSDTDTAAENSAWFDSVNGGSCDSTTLTFNNTTADTTTLSSLSSCAGTGRYLKYYVNFTAGGSNTVTPILDEVRAGVDRILYQSSGTYTSGAIDTGQKNTTGTTFTWDDTLNSGTISAEIRGSVGSGDLSGKSYCSISKGEGVFTKATSCVETGSRYFQYKATLNSSADYTQTPYLNSTTLAYYYYPANQTLTSSIFNSASTENVLSSVKIKGTLGSSGTAIKVQLRSSANGTSGWTQWCGSTACNDTDVFNFTSPTSDPGQSISIPDGHPLKIGTDDQYFQYKIILESAGDYAPTVESITNYYVVNAPPEAEVTNTVAEDAAGKVLVNYRVKDADSVSAAISLEYCTADCGTPGGETWAAASTYAAGDYGAQTVSTDWTAFSLTWDAKADYDNQYKGTNFKIRIKADDGELANRYGYGESNNFVLDTKNPSSPQVTLDRSAASGQVTVAVTEDTASGIEYALNYPNAAIDGSSDPCDFTTPSWNSFTYPSQAVTISDNNDDVRKACVLFKDAYGNTSTNSGNFAITPRNPFSFQYYDISNPEISDYRLVISWGVPGDTAEGKEAGSNGFNYYEIYRCSDDKDNPNCAPSAQYDTITQKAENYLTDSGLDSNLRYCYKYRIKDQNPDNSSAGDFSEWSGTQCATPGAGASSFTKNVSIRWDVDPDVNVPPDEIYTTQATINWTTVNAQDPNEDLLSDSEVCWRIQGNTGWSNCYSVSSYVSDHSITIPGRLLPNTTYEYMATSETPWSTTDSSQGTTPATFTTLSGPVIKNVATNSVSNTGASVGWDTEDDLGDPQNASSVVYYSNALTAGGDLSSPQTGSCAGGYISSHTCSLSGLTAGTQYYYYVYSAEEPPADGYAADTNGGNFYRFTTTTDNTAPVITPDAGNPVILTDTQAAVSWQTDERADSWIIYGTTASGAYSAPATDFDPENVSHNPYTDYIANSSSNLSHTFVMSLDSLVPNTTYYYRLVSEDASGNVTVTTESNFTTLEIQVGHPDLTDPGDPTVLQYSDTEAVVVFSAMNTDANSKLCYGTSSISDVDTCPTSQTITDDTKIHYYQLTGLAADTPYYVRSKITDSETSAINFTSANVSFTTLKTQIDQPDPLSIISTPADANTDDSADITRGSTYAFVSWTTDQAANQELDCSTVQGGPYNEKTTSDLTDYNVSHTLKIIGLSGDTKYYCQATSEDDLSPANYLTSSEFSFTTEKDPEYQHDPLSSITMLYNDGDEAGDPKVLTDTKAVIAFNTDQPALCTIEYGTIPGSYTEVPVSETSYNENHSMHLTGLIFSTPYYYQITCEDNLENTVTSSEYNFTTSAQLNTEEGWADSGDTTAPSISGVSAGTITGESATISWDTDEEANSLVKYGITTDYGSMAGNDLVNFDTAEYVTSHEVIINNLIPSTKYYYVVGSADASGNIGESSEKSFSTNSASNLSSIEVASAKLGEVTITWKSSEKTTSLVRFGETENYSDSKANNNYSTEHSITISNLKSNTKYYYRVEGKDKDNNLYSSQGLTFTPKSPPLISNVHADDVTEHSTLIRFSTNVATDALITYAPVDSGQPRADDASPRVEAGFQGKPEISSTHEIELKNLNSGITYTLKIKVRDEEGNETEGTFDNFTTLKDENPPKIEQVRTDSALAQGDKVQTIVRWNTDELATSYFIYKEGKNGQEKEIKVSEISAKEHVSIITAFKPGVVYYFKAKAIDQAKNEAVSGEYAMLTPRKKENIVQIIVNNFQDIFKWAKF